MTRDRAGWTRFVFARFLPLLLPFTVCGLVASNTSGAVQAVFTVLTIGVWLFAIAVGVYGHRKYLR